MAIGAQFAAALQALLKKLQQGQADVDYKEQARRLQFAQQEAGQMEAYPLALRSANQSSADRGLTQSGINLGMQGKINRNHAEALAGLNTGLETDVRELARQRLANQSEYDTGYGDLEIQDAASQAQNLITNGAPKTPVAPGVPVVPKPKPPAVMGTSTPSNHKIPLSPMRPKAPAVRIISKRKPATSSQVKYS